MIILKNGLPRIEIQELNGNYIVWDNLLHDVRKTYKSLRAAEIFINKLARQRGW